MREIKFRAYGCINSIEERMIYLSEEDNYFINNEGELIYVQATEGGCDYIGFDNVKLMQFTGLHDINGVEIYEGDVVRVDKLTFEPSYALPQNLTVKYYGSMFQFFRGEKCLMGLHLQYLEEGEIVGNIYEND